MFGKDSHGYVFFRSGWTGNDTAVFFKCGESLDVHGSHTTAHCDVWRGRSLIQRAGPWYNVKTRGGSCWHNNTMKFVSQGDDGRHPNTIAKNDVRLDFDAFLAWKRRSVEAGDIIEFEAKDDYARVLSDATAAVRKSCKSWTRELVWLGYQYLLVIDRVETLDKPVEQQWMAFLHGDQELDGRVATTLSGGNRLWCRTLLPEDAKLALEETKAGIRLNVTPPDNKPGKRLYVHLITTGPGKADEPKASVERQDGKVVVRVGEFTYTFDE
jgi:hypothetical protein